MINIYDLNVKFKNRNVFSHNYFSFSDTGITWLKGSSGSGKTTLLKVILNKVNYQGKCIIDGINYHSNTMITSKKVFGILSDDYLLINKTIEENLYFYYPDAVRHDGDIRHEQQFRGISADRRAVRLPLRNP